MKRTLRNGIAVAAMTGGLWFLGQATAGASEEINVSQNNETANSASVNGSEDGDSGAAAGSLQGNNADVDVEETTKVETGDVITGQNDQTVTVNTGDNLAVNKVVAIDDSTASGSITTNSGGNTVSPSISTGDANGANSPAVNNGADDGVEINIDQDNSAANKASASGSEDEGDSGALAGSAQGNNADVDVEETTKVETGDVITGQNTQDIELNTGGNVGVNNCKAYDDAVVHCTIVFNTGGNTVNPSITTGDANNANSPSVGNSTPPAQHHHYYPAKPAHHGHHGHHADCPDHKPAAAPAHHVKRAAPVAHRAPMVNAYAQPKGELAYTGAETTAPLALGLIALGAGGALTLAGRRRSTTATV